MTEAMLAVERLRDEIVEETPLGRLATIEEVVGPRCSSLRRGVLHHGRRARRRRRDGRMTITYLEAIRAAMADAMREDERVFLIGEDVGHFGGPSASRKDCSRSSATNA